MRCIVGELLDLTGEPSTPPDESLCFHLPPVTSTSEEKLAAINGGTLEEALRSIYFYSTRIRLENREKRNRSGDNTDETRPDWGLIKNVLERAKRVVAEGVVAKSKDYRCWRVPLGNSLPAVFGHVCQTIAAHEPDPALFEFWVEFILGPRVGVFRSVGVLYARGYDYPDLAELATRIYAKRLTFQWKRLRRLVPYVALIYNCKLAWAHARLNPDGGSGFADLREDFVAHGGSA
jgi:hypothetical protein